MFDPKDIADCTAMIRSTITALNALIAKLESAEKPADGTNDVPVEKPVTKEELRAVLAGKITAGFGNEVRALIQQCGVNQLSDVNAENYPAMMKAALAIGTEEGNA